MRLRISPGCVVEQEIFNLSEASTAYDAARYMVEHNVAAVIVTDENDKLRGIVTERDLTRRVVAAGMYPDKVTLADIMTENPDTLSPNDLAVKALEKMQKHQYRHLPVMDGDRIVGMVSIRDLYAAVKEMLEKNVRETQAYMQRLVY